MAETILAIIQTILAVAKILISFLIIVIAALITILFMKSIKFRPKINVEKGMKAAKALPVSHSQMQATQVFAYRDSAEKQWAKLLEKVGKADEKDLPFILIKADSLVDDALVENGFPGKDMGERLKAAHMAIKNIDDLWEAHKTRNKLAHEPDFHIEKDDAMKFLNTYHQALEQLLERELELI